MIQNSTFLEINSLDGILSQAQNEWLVQLDLEEWAQNAGFPMKWAKWFWEQLWAPSKYYTIENIWILGIPNFKVSGAARE